MAEKKRKYLLFNRADGRPDSLKPCAFFFSPAGCRNGDKCPFSHTNNPESVEAVSSSNTITTGVVSHANSNTESREENPRSNKKKKVTTQSVEQSAASVDPEIARLKEELERQKKLYEAAISAKASGSSSSSNAVANRGTPAVKTVPIAKLTPVAKPAPVKATPIAKPAGKLPATEPNIGNAVYFG